MRALVLGGLAILALAPAAHAQGFVTPYLGFNFGGNSNCTTLMTCENKRMQFGVSVGGFGKSAGFEEDIAYGKNFFGEAPGADNYLFTLMSNVLVGGGGGKVQPYGLFGAGVLKAHTTVNTAPSVTQTFEKQSFGWDFGGGANIYFSRVVGVRADIRRFRSLEGMPYLGNLSGDEQVSFWRATVGVSIRF